VACTPRRQAAYTAAREPRVNHPFACDGSTRLVEMRTTLLALALAFAFASTGCLELFPGYSEDHDDTGASGRGGTGVTTGSGSGSGTESGSGSGSTTPPPPPILHYRLDGSLANEGSLGLAYDATGAGFTYVAGRDGQAAQFAHVNPSQIVLPTQELMSGGDAFTIALWFREDAVVDTVLTSYLFDSRGNGGFQTYHGAGGNEALTTCSAAGCASFGYSIGVWHHLVYRYDGRSGQGPLEIYIDAKLAASIASSNVYFSDTQKNIVIGTRTNMQIDDIKIYDEPIAPAAAP
jgi:hypothetical protein